MKYLLFLFLVFTVSFSSSKSAIASTYFNVLRYGAVGNGLVDDSQAFLRAWEDMCAAMVGIPTLVAPMGKTYLLKPINFKGPCKSPQVNFQLRGTLIAPKGRDEWPSNRRDRWIQFSDIYGLIINGGGEFDGQGSFWWKDCDGDCQRPTALFLHNCNRLQLREMRHINSAKNHISINACTHAVISNLQIIAPEDSPNTDGIDISSSSNLLIHSSFIGTGDDCIAINTASFNIQIIGVTCGPGHGISIGSLGRDGEFNTVENIHVQNCLLKGTQNGVRIKTWEGGSGYARNILFEKITLVNAKNPIIIDQHYNALALESQNMNFDVKVSDVTYRDVHGTSASENAIVFDCGRSGCTNITMENVGIRTSIPGKPAKAFCQNVQGKSTMATPPVPCLSSYPLL